MTRDRFLMLVLLMMMWCSSRWGSISPNNVAVIANVHPQLYGMSRRIADYYCAQRGIPSTNVLEINVSPYERIEAYDWSGPNGWNLSGQIRDELVSELGIDPNDFANDTIQALVMCYGVPATIIGPTQNEDRSVDSFLTLLFNSDPDVGPTEYPCVNPYFGKDIDFASFRASVDNSTLSGSTIYKMRYMVCRLDA